MNQKSSRAFTLIELAITVALIAVVMALAVPSFSELVRSNRVTTLNNELVAAMSFARQSAISLGTTVFVCHTNTADQAVPVCADTGSSWGTGVLVYSKPTSQFSFANTASQVYSSANDELLYQNVLGDGTSIVVEDVDANAVIGFSRLGFEFRQLGTVSVSVCDSKKKDVGSRLTLSAAGKVSSQATTCT